MGATCIQAVWRGSGRAGRGNEVVLFAKKMRSMAERVGHPGVTDQEDHLESGTDVYEGWASVHRRLVTKFGANLQVCLREVIEETLEADMHWSKRAESVKYVDELDFPRPGQEFPERCYITFDDLCKFEDGGDALMAALEAWNEAAAQGARRELGRQKEHCRRLGDIANSLKAVARRAFYRPRPEGVAKAEGSKDQRSEGEKKSEGERTSEGEKKSGKKKKSKLVKKPDLNNLTTAQRLVADASKVFMLTELLDLQPSPENNHLFGNLRAIIKQLVRLRDADLNALYYALISTPEELLLAEGARFADELRAYLDHCGREGGLALVEEYCDTRFELFYHQLVDAIQGCAMDKFDSGPFWSPEARNLLGSIQAAASAGLPAGAFGGAAAEAAEDGDFDFDVEADCGPDEAAVAAAEERRGGGPARSDDLSPEQEQHLFARAERSISRALHEHPELRSLLPSQQDDATSDRISHSTHYPTHGCDQPDLLCSEANAASAGLEDGGVQSATTQRVEPHLAASTRTPLPGAGGADQ